ncbi:MAG: molecular chaperone DjiA, partial [Pseudomonadota bacterium]
MSLWVYLLNAGRSLFEPETLPEPGEGEDGCAPEPNDAGFTAAVVGLGAKLAAADGVVTDDEVMVFSRVFQATEADMPAVRRV